MDRKSQSIAKDISSLRKDVDNLKSTQPFGYDTTDLKLIQSSNSYDEIHVINSGDRLEISGGCYDLDNVYARAYNQILFQLWIGNMSTPYYGESSGIGVFTPTNTVSPFAPVIDRVTVELINTSASSKVVYVKWYTITTFKNGTMGL